MKTYEEIKDVIVNKLGITDQASYKAYIDQFHRQENPKIATEEEIALLSPDNIDNNAFWRVTEEIFFTDPVANCRYGTPHSVEESNRLNLGMYHLDGFIGLINYILINHPEKKSVLEIGPGYGAFKNWIKSNTNWDYYGTDVYPKCPDVDAAELTGRFSMTTRSRTYDLVISSNVFQHLSVAQRREHYRDAASCLSHGGWFMVSMMTDNYGYHPARDEKGCLWCRHYGQMTEIQKVSAVKEDLGMYFNVNVTSLRENYWSVFTCTKKG